MKIKKEFDDKEVEFVIIPNEEEEILCTLILSFESKETKTHYVVYTDNTNDEEGVLNVYASILAPNRIELLPITTEREWQIVGNILNMLIKDW